MWLNHYHIIPNIAMVSKIIYEQFSVVFCTLILIL